MGGSLPTWWLSKAARTLAPLRVNDDAVRLAVITRLGWIKRQQLRYRDQERQSRREYISGETHYWLGQRYRLHVLEHDEAAQVTICRNRRRELKLRSGSSAAQREKTFPQVVWAAVQSHGCRPCWINGRKFSGCSWPIEAARR
ncbi:MAG: M48 family metallopeptidase [Proteobacteria bacterium]|nr:M48 family metallopeptidase [Pseudomonadota bacterium]